MRREEQAPTVREDGRESHPAWGLIGAYRVTGSARLFDSDINHHHFIVVRLSRATRDRKLGRDWIHPENEADIAEIAMSEAQWASFVSSMNSGSGVPCTLERTEVDGIIPSFPSEPRLAESMKEVRNASAKALEEIREAQEAVDEAFERGAGKKEMRSLLQNLKFRVRNGPANMNFAAESLTEHAENVVQRARADIEAMVVQQAQAVGIEPSEIKPIALTEGEGVA
jgi:hypothetical protein